MATAPRHRALPSRRRGAVRSAIVGLAAAVLLALSGVNATYAYLSSSAPIGGGTVRSGTAAITATAPSPALDLVALYPGSAGASAHLTVANTGNAPLAITVTALTATAAATPFSAALTVSIGTAASAALCDAGVFTAAFTGTVGAAVASPVPIGVTLDPAAPNARSSANAVRTTSAVVCVAVSLPTTALDGGQGRTAGFVVTLGGRQV